jgi:ribosomal protein L23
MSILNSQIYYFSIDYKATKKAIKNHIDLYNKKINELWAKGTNKTEFEKVYGKGQTYGKLSIKSTEETTVWCALDLLAGFVQQNAIEKDTDDDFRISNKALATKKHNRMVLSTAYRHVKKIVACGIFTNKKFNGTKAGYSITWNKELLHFNQNFDFNTELVGQYKALCQLKNFDAPLNATKGLYSLKCKGSQLIGLGYSVATCNLNYTTILLLEHNINIESGIVNFSLPPQTVETQINNVFSSESLNTECAKGLEATPPIAPAPPAPDFSGTVFEPVGEMIVQGQQAATNIEKAEQYKTAAQFEGSSIEQMIWFHVIRVYAFALSTLYENRAMSDFERNLGCLQIYHQFKKHIAKSKAQDVKASLFIMASDFNYRILLTKKYLNKNPYFNQPVPQTYFDVDSNFGFNKTAEWLATTKKMRDKNKEYLSHYKTLIQCYNEYSKNPCLKSYQSANARLSKMKNPVWKTYFNECVANLKQFDKVEINHIWKSEYQATA